MTPIRLLTSAAFVVALAVPAFAESMMDAGKMTCKEMGAMDAKGMMDATMAIKKAAMDDKMADNTKMGMSDEDMMKMIEKSCEGKPDMMVMDAMHADK